MTANTTSHKRGRPRNKDYGPMVILQTQIDLVSEVYDNLQEIKATALELGLAELKVRKLLITAGAITYGLLCRSKRS